MTLLYQLQGLAALCQRYRRVWQAAWQNRKTLDGAGYTRSEAQFLPATLALTETPVSPAPRLVMWLLMGFAALALVWAIAGRIDIVASAQGKIVPNARTKIIQPLEVATVTAIHVTDGQRVKAGDVLIELDPTASAADQARILNDLAQARLQAARAQAMLDAIESGKPPHLNPASEIPDVAYQEARVWLQGQYSDYQTRIARIDAESAKREAEKQSTAEVVKKIEQTLPLAQQRAQDFKDLVSKNFVSKHGYLEKEQARLELEADLATQRSRYRELEAALKETRAQRSAQTAESRKIHLEILNDGIQKAAALSQDLRKAETRVKQTTLTAPVDGTVQQLAAHTVGGVVTEAQPLMIIVPTDDPLEIEAFLENKDIGFVSPGHEATVKIETFQYTKYGTIDGTVTTVSNDAINDEKRGLVYSTRVKLKTSTIQVDGKTVNLAPGMAATVEVKTGKRRVIEYFLTPLMQYSDESLRER
ncbi:HlyD family type I secretion periplasmic adaptor subunit [Cupriavidus basilensis]|uniref:Membrane fusion protein (MFP) family protein n=1 Tax=Cupriavidus basilensis TaxID=68895 RepID=A0ABT6AUR7_9BURK|nr:HlyD family type I secretion periplasmic adaptor subunit [Cupriavidus basilensis]MDF3836229.1 HlyD family type I secretion periplasmic adaptor subunit [Cupriavidus basilensis]